MTNGMFVALLDVGILLINWGAAPRSPFHISIALIRDEPNVITEYSQTGGILFKYPGSGF